MLWKLRYFKPANILHWLRTYTQNTQTELALATLSYSGNGEDVFIWNFFGTRNSGFYVDVGAFHPIVYSNTHLLYKQGWHGINIEPDPDGFAQFRALRRRDTNLNLAISATNGESKFVVDGPMSGIPDQDYTFSRTQTDQKLITVKTAPLADILAAHLPAGQQIDVMSIDCEGHDLVVIESNDWTRFRPRMLLVEDHTGQPHSNLNDVMEKHGYLYYCRLRVTKIFLERNEAPKYLVSASNAAG